MNQPSSASLKPVKTRKMHPATIKKHNEMMQDIKAYIEQEEQSSPYRPSSYYAQTNKTTIPAQQ